MPAAGARPAATRRVANATNLIPRRLHVNAGSPGRRASGDQHEPPRQPQLATATVWLEPNPHDVAQTGGPGRVERRPDAPVVPDRGGEGRPVLVGPGRAHLAVHDGGLRVDQA